MTESLLERHAGKIKGVLGCYDRVVVRGTLPPYCWAGGMTGYLREQRIRIFDYPRWAEKLRDEVAANAQSLAAANGLKIEYLGNKKRFRKDERVAAIVAERGRQPGLVHIFSALEPCLKYQPWRDKKTGETWLRRDSGKCLHYYFYFIDAELGLCYLRIPTYCPFGAQFYFNGHQRLAAALKRAHITHELQDNAFVDVADFERAQQISDALRVNALHIRLDLYAAKFCPVLKTLKATYHWSLMQVEYATDIVFNDRQALRDLYEPLIRTMVHAVKPEHVASFLGKKRIGAASEVVTDFTTRPEGTRVKHWIGHTSIKMYDKFGIVLRIETTTSDVTHFQHHRMVEQRNGQRVCKLAPIKKTIYSLDPDLRELLSASNRRYLAYISELDLPTAGVSALRKVTERTREHRRSYAGLNFFREADYQLLQAIVRGEFVISGMRNKDLQALTARSTSQISHLIKRLRTHGILKKIVGTYKYYVTELGRRVLLAGCKIKELFLIPALATPSPTH